MTCPGQNITRKLKPLRFREFIFLALSFLPFMGGVNSGELPLMTIFRVSMELLLTIVFVVDYIKRPYEIYFNRFFLIYLLYSLCTIIWAPKTLFFIYKYCEVIFMYLLFIRFSKGLNDTLKVVRNILLLNVILSFSFFSKGFNIIDNILPYQLRGAIFTLNPNDFGFLACTILLWKYIHGDKKWYNYFIWFSILVLTQSRIYLGFLIMLSAFYLLKKKPVLFGWIGLSAFLSGLPLIILSFFQRSKSIEDLSSLNGRVGFWELGIRHWMDAPIFGHGWYTGHRFLTSIEGVKFDSNTFDSTVIDLLADIGLVGLVLFIMIFINVYKYKRVRLLTIALILKALIGPSVQVLHPSMLVLFSILIYGPDRGNMPNFRLQSPRLIRKIT